MNEFTPMSRKQFAVYFVTMLCFGLTIGFALITAITYWQ